MEKLLKVRKVWQEKSEAAFSPFQTVSDNGKGGGRGETRGTCQRGTGKKCLYEQ